MHTKDYNSDYLYIPNSSGIVRYTKSSMTKYQLQLDYIKHHKLNYKRKLIRQKK